MTNLANPATNGVRAIAGIAMLLPSVSSATVGAEPKALALGGPGIIVRVISVASGNRRPVQTPTQSAATATDRVGAGALTCPAESSSAGFWLPASQGIQACDT